MIRICRQYSVQRLVAAVAAVIVCMVPSPDELLVRHPLAPSHFLPVVPCYRFYLFTFPPRL